MTENPIGLDGMEFIEYSGKDASLFKNLFADLGMIEIAKHKSKNITLFRQNDVNFILNEEPGLFAQEFSETHGPSVCSTGFRVKDAQAAFDAAIERGAKPYKTESKKSFDWPTIYGIGDSLIYFVDKYGDKGNGP
jgi:4-hydroxyphenylpyruvate dioxygenase